MWKRADISPPVVRWESITVGNLVNITLTDEVAFKLSPESMLVFSNDEPDSDPVIFTLEEYSDSVGNNSWLDEGFNLIDPENYLLTVNY